MARETKFFLVLGIIGIISLIGYHLLYRQEGSHRPKAIGNDCYKIGQILIDMNKGEITFTAKVYKQQDWVQFLLYLDGYKWLKEESALVSQARLADLQEATALLDWQLWDKLWHKTRRPEDQRLVMYIEQDKKETLATDLLLAQDPLGIEDLVFLGSPYFDPIALRNSPGVDCRLCPLFPSEEKALRESFVRDSGESGYRLDPSLFPSKGTEVAIIIRKP